MVTHGSLILAFQKPWRVRNTTVIVFHSALFEIVIWFGNRIVLTHLPSNCSGPRGLRVSPLPFILCLLKVMLVVVHLLAHVKFVDVKTWLEVIPINCSQMIGRGSFYLWLDWSVLRRSMDHKTFKAMVCLAKAVSSGSSCFGFCREESCLLHSYSNC